MHGVRVLIAPDSFGSSLTADEAADVIAGAWRAVAPDDDVLTCPLSDGGPGFVATLHRALGGGSPWIQLGRDVWGLGWVVVFFAILNSTFANGNAGTIATTRTWFAMSRIGLLPSPHLIAGSLSAADRDAVFAWVALNRDVLLEHWNGAIDGGEMAARSQRLP